MYADFESSLNPFEHQQADVTSRTKYLLHTPNSCSLLIKLKISEEHLRKYESTSTPKMYRGEESARNFVDELYNIAGNVEKWIET